MARKQRESRGWGPGDPKGHALVTSLLPMGLDLLKVLPPPGRAEGW